METRGGKTEDVPYAGVASSCDPHEGLYVKFENYPEEMLVTNEDTWLWESDDGLGAPPDGRWNDQRRQ